MLDTCLFHRRQALRKVGRLDRASLGFQHSRNRRHFLGGQTARRHGRRNGPQGCHIMRFLLPSALAVALLVGSGAYASTFPLAKAAGQEGLRDPSSAQFRDALTGICNEDIKYILGWLNGKNGYGGDQGFIIFLVRTEHNTAVVMHAYGQEFRAAAVCNGLAP